MVQSLVSRGVPFELALETATAVRDRIEDRGEVQRFELAQLVQELLGDRAAPEHLPLRQEAPTPLVRDQRGFENPFSKGLLALSLQGAGMDTSDAQDAARELEALLLRQGRAEIDRSELRDLVAKTVERTHGGAAAQRYRVWRRARDDMRPIFLLLGGTTGVGKTSIAVDMGRRFQISRVIGTDSIRQIMRLMFSESLMPEIHCSTYEAHHVLGLEPAGSSEAVIAGFREQAQKIAVGVHALLDRAVEENTSMIIEGVNLVPGLIDADRYAQSAHTISLVIATLDRARYEERFRERAATAQERAAERYLDHLDEIQLIQDHILHEADHYGLQLIDNVRFDDAVLAATRSVIAALEGSVTLEQSGLEPGRRSRLRAAEEP